jgi:uracil-DNA glycosylase
MERDEQKKHLVLKYVIPFQIFMDRILKYIHRSPHPSPLSAHRGFLGNNHFKLANEWLQEKYGEGEEINWAALTA